MRLLYEAGMPCHAQSFDVAFEHEDAQRLPDHWTWLKRCAGKAVKILDPHVYVLPRGLRYDFIWIDRNPLEQAKSQVKFLRAMGMPIHCNSGQLKKLSDSLVRDQPIVIDMLKSYPDSRLLRLTFESLIERPVESVAKIAEFTGLPVSPSAIVQRSPKCYPGILELSLLEAHP